MSAEFGGAQGEGAISAVRLVLLGDINRDGAVNFSDVPPLVALLIGRVYQTEGDIDQNGAVNFSDVPLFVNVLLDR